VAVGLIGRQQKRPGDPQPFLTLNTAMQNRKPATLTIEFPHDPSDYDIACEGCTIWVIPRGMTTATARAITKVIFANVPMLLRWSVSLEADRK
jgi:hypothetical protein